MRNDSSGATLEPLKFLLEPVVIETDGESAWLAWDSAVRDFDDPADLAAARLAERKEP